MVGAGPCSRTRRLPPCRYSKAKASQGPGGDKQQQGLGLAQANFGPKYEQHVAQLQQELEGLKSNLEAMKRQEQALR